MAAKVKRKGPRKLKKTGHKTPLGVRKAQQVIRHRRKYGKHKVKRARATIRAYNKKQAKRSKKPRISAVQPGVLEVPVGKKVNQLPLKHFMKLVRKKGHTRVSTALTNLQRWFKNKKPSLSRWAKSMKAKIRRKLGKPKLKVKKGGKRKKKRVAARKRRRRRRR
jgi:hypothetical protein